MGRLLNTKQATLVCAAARVGGVGLLPLCVVIASSVSVNSGLSARNYVEMLGSARTWALFRNSLLLAASTTAVLALAGVPLGVLLAKTDLPLRKSLAVAFCLPLVFPPYILAVGWFEILGRGCLLARWFDISAGSEWLFALPGVLLVVATAFLPLVILLTMTYIRG